MDKNDKEDKTKLRKFAFGVIVVFIVSAWLMKDTVMHNNYDENYPHHYHSRNIH